MNKKTYIITLTIIVFTCGVLAGVFNMFSGKDKMYYTAASDNTIGIINEAAKVEPRFLFAAIKLIIDKNYVEKIDAKLAEEMTVTEVIED